jgi:transcription elongation factor Elf1
MNCPVCEGTTRVVYTVKKTRIVTRTRICRSCGAATITDEVARKTKKRDHNEK